ncbi:MAG: demethoxyubiquinone hydroxylase family protein [Gammaproteobacteria bacterium]|nr:demethoxyubiquinone hydroxylase family protein [Gammaproteobacteria bacterium]
MKYSDSKTGLDTPRKILKVNHAGEFGAVNIYRSQLLIARIFMKDLVPLIEDFLADERRHLDVFWQEIQRRNGVKCKSYWLCGIGGYVLGFVSALMGRRGIMACTWAVENVVVNHLHNQILYLRNKDDLEALAAVETILEDEENHRDTGFESGGTGNLLYQPLRFAISTFTEGVIRFGMR